MLVIDACIQPGTDRTDALIAWDRGMRRRQAAGDDGHALPPQSVPHGLPRTGPKAVEVTGGSFA